MPRFWLTGAGVILFAATILILLNLVKTGIIDPQGQWLGPWPLDGADDCRTKLLPDGRFEMECRGQSAYLGAGTWSQERDEIKLAFKFFARNGRNLPDGQKSNLKISAVPGGIRVESLDDHLPPAIWKRAHP